MPLQKSPILFLLLLLAVFPQPKLSAQSYTFEDYLYSPVHDIPVGACEGVNGGYIIPLSYHTLVKLDDDGQLAWSKDIQLTSSALSYYYHSIAQSADSAYLLSGYISVQNPTSGYDESILVTKVDTLGNLIWSNYIDSTGGTYITNILSTPDGGALVAYTELGPPDRNIMLARFSGSGLVLWHKRYTISSIKNVSYAITKSHDGGYVIASKYDAVGFVLKVDSLGNQVWTKTTSIPITLSNNMTDIARAGSGYAFMMMTPDLYFINASGTAIIDKQYAGVNGSVVFSLMTETSDQGLIISGRWNDANHTNSPMLMKTDSVGNVQWAEVYRRNFCYPAEQFETSDGGYFMVDEIVISNTYKSYAIRTDASGNSDCNNMHISLTNAPVNFSMSSASCVITNGPQTVVSLTGTTPPRALSDSIKCSTLIGVNELGHGNDFSIYPNPADGSFTVSAAKGSSITVYDLLGNLVAAKIAQTDLTQIDLSPFASGLYAVVISDGKKSSVAKLVKK